MAFFKYLYFRLILFIRLNVLYLILINFDLHFQIIFHIFHIFHIFIIFNLFKLTEFHFSIFILFSFFVHVVFHFILFQLFKIYFFYHQIKDFIIATDQIFLIVMNVIFIFIQ